MEWTIKDGTNFLRVFQLPKEFPSDYCFGGGHATCFMMVDWFNAVSPEKLWKAPAIQFSEKEYSEHIDKLRGYIKEKRYFNPEHTYMVLTDYGDVFLVNPSKRAGDLQGKMDELKGAPE